MSSRRTLLPVRKVAPGQKPAPITFDKPHFLFDKPFDLSLHTLEVAEISSAEYLDALNGRAKLDVPRVRREHKVEMNGTVPESWRLL